MERDILLQIVDSMANCLYDADPESFCALMAYYNLALVGYYSQKREEN